MYRIALINMPFASVTLPSIALTQLKSVLDQELGGRVEVEIFYPNQDYARIMGMKLYRTISESVAAVTSGLGDWFFRQVAFPELADNADLYLTRHFPQPRDELQGPLVEARQQAETILDEVIDRYQLESSSMVGMTSMFSQNVACFAMARKLKERHPELITAMGGANCETPMGQEIAKNVENIDFVFSGPALDSFPRLVRHVIAGEPEKCHEIPGIFSRQRLEAHSTENLREVGKELDIEVDIPLDYDGFMASLEGAFPEGGVEPVLPFETSRGCWWGERSHCTFCGLNGLTMKYRSMSPQKALALLESLFERYGSKAKRFQSVDNILPREYLTELLPHLHPPENATIFYEVKADLKAHEMAALAQAGVTQIQPGIEALATSTLKLMRKGTTSFQNIRFLKYCLLYGVQPHWNLLMGFPGEEEEVYAKYFSDLPHLVHFPPPSGAYPVRFDRYSPYYTQAKEYGLKLRAADFYHMIYPFDPRDLESMAYFFADMDYAAPYLANTAKWITRLRQRIDHWQTRYEQRDRGLEPKLELNGEGDARGVVDTRSGRKVEHHLGPAALEVLALLAKPMKLERLAKRLTDVPEAELKRQVMALKGKGLLFQENGIYMSLVMEPEPAGDMPWIAPAERAQSPAGLSSGA